MALKAILKNEITDASGSAFLVGDLLNKTDVAEDTLTQITFIVYQSTWAGETAKIQIAPTSSGPWVDDSDGTFTANAAKTSPLSAQCYVRVTTSSTSSSTAGVTVYAG